MCRFYLGPAKRRVPVSRLPECGDTSSTMTDRSDTSVIAAGNVGLARVPRFLVRIKNDEFFKHAVEIFFYLEVIHD